MKQIRVCKMAPSLVFFYKYFDIKGIQLWEMNSILSIRNIIIYFDFLNVKYSTTLK